MKVQQQYTLTRRQAKRMTAEEREKLVPVPVRIMGSLPPAGSTPTVDPYASLYLVARDVCQLIHLRQGSVSKVIHDFLPSERSRIPILCQRSTGAGCTQVLTVLTMDGVRRLLGNSQSPLAPHVLKWMTEQMELVVREGVKGGGSGGPIGMDGRAVKLMLRESGMVLEADQRNERKRERGRERGAEQYDEQQHSQLDTRTDSSGGTDKKSKTDQSSPATSSAVSSAFTDSTSSHAPAAFTQRHRVQQQSAFSSAASLQLLSPSTLSAGSPYQQLLLDAQQRELAVQVQAMQVRVRDNEQMMMLQQQHRQQQQQLLSSAFPSLPLSSSLPAAFAASVRPLVPPLDSPSSASSSLSHALLQHQLLAAYQQQQQHQPAASPLGLSQHHPLSLSGAGSGNTGSAFTSPSTASSVSGSTTGLLSPVASPSFPTTTASFKPRPPTFTPLTLPLQAN